MKCCIVGVGATGGHLAVKLGLAGHEVSVLARGETLAAVRHDGVTLVEAAAEHRTRPVASDDAAALGPQDVVFVATKATALAGMAPQIRALVGSGTQSVFLQNGMTWWYPVGLSGQRPRPPALPMFDQAGAFLDVLAPSQLLGGIVYSANEVRAPGVVQNNSPGRNGIEIGAVADASADDVARVRSLLVGAGIDSAPVADIRAALWLKLVGNCSASSLCVATGNPAAIVNDPAIQATFLRMMDECMAVAEVHGYPLAGGIDLKRWTQHRARHKPSMLQDYEAGRPMEIAEMVLAPVAFARAAGIATPTLDAVTAIAARLAADKGLYGGSPPSISSCGLHSNEIRLSRITLP